MFDQWLLDDSDAKPSANEVALGLGSLVGELLKTQYGCRWVVITDEQGCDLGMLHHRTGWQMFPRDWVAKRLDPKNAGTGTISGIVGALRKEGVIGDK